MKLIVVSNRLPLTVSKKDGGFNYNKTSGGLVTGIESLSSHMKFIWIGSIGGTDMSQEDMDQVTHDCLDQFGCFPVFLSPELYDRYYNGFCNAILWPALHSFPDDVCFSYKEYEEYKKANFAFADRILEKCEDGDIVWVHDYHLMLLPSILKSRNSTLRIMFFFHTAFPDPSNLERIFYKNELLGSISCCDVVSFHTPDYVLNFKKAIRDSQSSAIIKAISIGIDPEMFRTELARPETQKRIKELKERFAGKRIILGVDRTDYIKGMPHKVKGFRRFLTRHPEMENKVVFLQIGIPSRLDVREYMTYVSKISELVTEVNGAVGNITNTPVHLLLSSVTFSELVALYAVSEILLITSIMDGMNLVALEYVASHTEENPGAVVLSKFAGATVTLQGAVQHNPNNTEEIADAIEQALELEDADKVERYKKNIRNIDIFTSVKWAQDNLDCVYSGWRDELQ